MHISLKKAEKLRKKKINNNNPFFYQFKNEMFTLSLFKPKRSTSSLEQKLDWLAASNNALP